MGKIIRICFLCLSVLILLTGCGSKQKNGVDKTTPDTKTETIAFKSRDENKLVDKEVPIHSLGKEEIVREIYGLLQEGIEDTDVVATIPKNLILKEVTFDGDSVKLNFSEEYNNMEASEETICRTSLGYSLTNLPFVNYVYTFINDVSLKGTDGKPMEPFTKEQLITDDNSQQEQKRTKNVMLYFANNEATGLVSYEDVIEINTNEPLEKTVLKLLIAGPKDEGLISTIPEGTKIISISISEGVCYVDLSREFISKHPGGSAGEKMTIYSIVNTLTELPDVSKVQFLIEGEKQEVFKGHLQFDGLFERNLDLVITK